MISLARHLLIYLIALSSSQLGAQELDIKRTSKEVREIQEDGLLPGWKRLGDDLVSARFLIPYFSDHMAVPAYSDGAAANDDPFAFANEPTGIKILSAQQALESAGIPFGELASATFDPATSIVTVINTAKNMELVEVYTGSIRGLGPAKAIAVRLEIYEMTKLQALQLQESAQSATDHKPERNAALGAVRGGEAKLATTVSVTSSQGQRAALTDSIDVLYPIIAEPGSTEESTGFYYSKIGTMMEIEATFESDGQTINLNIAVEHHTAPPDLDTVIDGLVAPKFHAKSLETNVQLIEGEYLLLGNWTPTGKPEYANGDLVQVAFVTASIQRESYGWGIITVEEVEE